MRLLENDIYKYKYKYINMLIEMPTCRGPRNGRDWEPRAPSPSPSFLKKYIKESKK